MIAETVDVIQASLCRYMPSHISEFLHDGSKLWHDLEVLQHNYKLLHVLEY